MPTWRVWQTSSRFSWTKHPCASRSAARGSRRRGTSSRLGQRQLPLLHRLSGERERGEDVLDLQVGVVRQDLRDGPAGRELAEDSADCDAGVPDAGKAAHPVRVDDDSVHWSLLTNIVLGQPRRDRPGGDRPTQQSAGAAGSAAVRRWISSTPSDSLSGGSTARSTAHRLCEAAWCNGPTSPAPAAVWVTRY